MTKIAVVCALPPSRNTGMVTVDLAAQCYFDRLRPRAEIRMFSYGQPTIYGYQPGELPFEHTDITRNPAEYLSSDLFVFWGDFIHARSYLKYDLRSWKEPADGVAPLNGAYSKHVFLSDTPEAVLARSIAFGSTIITNDASDDADAGYRKSFDRLYRNLGGVFLRDAFSAARIAALRGDNPTLGCDCAFLLEDADLNRLQDFEMARERKGVGVFFGRSRSKAMMLLFSRAVGKALGEECSWIPWFWSQRRVRWPAAICGYRFPSEDLSPGALLKQLSGYRYIVTDTYHVCVNAWRLGIPAICIGQGSSASEHSLADKKKEVLFEMYGARRLYVFLETLSLAGGLAAAARRAAQAASDDSYTAQVRANIADHRAMAERRLTAQIQRGIAMAAAAREARRGPAVIALAGD